VLLVVLVVVVALVLLLVGQEQTIQVQHNKGFLVELVVQMMGAQVHLLAVEVPVR
jgi:hypothetical protein